MDSSIINSSGQTRGLEFHFSTPIPVVQQAVYCCQNIVKEHDAWYHLLCERCYSCQTRHSQMPFLPIFLTGMLLSRIATTWNNLKAFSCCHYYLTQQKSITLRILRFWLFSPLHGYHQVHLFYIRTLVLSVLSHVLFTRSWNYWHWHLGVALLEKKINSLPFSLC